MDFADGEKWGNSRPVRRYNQQFDSGFALGMKGMENTRKTGYEVIRFISAAYSSHIITKHM